MNFDRSLIFAYLEEDNLQRAYFRVLPLLSLEGDIRQEALQLWPNEGGLRIVPDRNEQHTFKTRMRTLGSYCVIDLRNQPPEAGKIRTNKNFKPDRGEINQYILYSDTVHELPSNTFFQLFEGDATEYAAYAAQSVTPMFFIKQADTLYGPVAKEAHEAPAPAEEAAAVLFEIPCPDGTTRMMLCIDPPSEVAPVVDEVEATADSAPEVQTEAAVQSEAPAQPDCAAAKPETPPTAEELPIGETLHILENPADHDDTIQQLDQPVSAGANLLRQKDEPPAFQPVSARPSEPLTGTPLVKKPLHVSTQQTKNRTQEVISNQWNVGKYEPPAQSLPAGATLRSVKNPVEDACAALRTAWSASGAHGQLTDCILSLDGIRTQLESKLCAGSSGTMLQRVLKQRLQDLEAERLTALCELDKARRDTDAYKLELLNAIAGKLQRETKQLEQDNSAAKALNEQLKDEFNALTLQRDALLAKIHELQSATLPEAVAKLVAEAQMAAPSSGTPLRMSPVSGNLIEADDLINRVCDICKASGIAVDRNTAIALLVSFAGSPRIGFACPTPAAFSTLAKNVVANLGWLPGFAQQYASEQHPLVGSKPVDSTPAVLLTNLPNYAPISGATKLLLSRNTANQIRNAAYDVSQWPVWTLPALPYVDELIPAAASIVSAASVQQLLEKTSVTDRELTDVLGPILKAAIPLSGAARKEMFRFISVCAGLMEGGLPVAADWGILLWIVPAIEKGTKLHADVKALLDEYPRSRSHL